MNVNGNRLARVLHRIVTKTRDERLFGTLGRLNADGTRTIHNALRPGYVMVEMDGGTVDENVRWLGDVALRQGMRVRVLVTHDSEHILDGEDYQLMSDDPLAPDDDYGVRPHPIGSHSDATITAAVSGDVLAHNGTAWVDEAPIVTSAGAGDAGKLVRLDAGGQVDATMVNDADISLDNVTEGATNKFYTDAEKTKLTGIEAGANLYVHPNHTGDVTSAGDGATTIANDAVTNAKSANMATATIKGRTTAGTGDPEDLTATQARTILNVADGADVTGAAINAAAADTPLDADKWAFWDVVDAALKSITHVSLKAVLKTYFDTLYGLLASANTWTQVNTFSSRVDAPIVRANSAAGLRGEDDAGNLGWFVANGGNVGIGRDATAPAFPVAVHKNANGATNVLIFNTTDGTSAQAGGGASRTSPPSDDFMTYGITAPSYSGSGYGHVAYFHSKGAPFKLGTLDTESLHLFTNGIANSRVVIDSSGKVGVMAGTSGNDAAVGGDLYVDSTSRANSGTGETDLASYTVPANTLSSNNMYLEVNAHIRFEGVAGTKTIKFYFGADTFTVHATTDTGTDIRVMIRLYRTGAATQKLILFVATQAGNSISVYTLTRTLSGSNVLKFTGQATGGSNSITQHTMDVIYHNANV